MNSKKDELQAQIHYRLIESLSSSEKRFETLVEHLQEAVFEVNADRVFTFLNPMWETLTGYKLGESLGARICHYVYAKDRKRCRALFTFDGNLLNPNKQDKIRFKDKTGEIKWFVVSINFDESNTISGSLHDITHLQKTREDLEASMLELKSAQAQLIQSEKIAGIGQLAAGVSHEFGNLLTIMDGYAQHAQRNPAKENYEKLVEIVLSTSERAKNIIKGMLSFSRKTELKKVVTDVKNLVENVLVIIENSLKKEGMEIERDYNKSAEVFADPGQIQQVLLNMILNARDAMAGTGGRITITTDVILDKLLIQIKDTGCGIPAKNLSHIFNPFFTTKHEVTSSGRPGTGLGLSVSYGIIKDHCGEITCTSKVGEGTTFNIYLPLLQNDSKALPQTDTKKALLNQFNRVKSLKILVVDDEVNIASLLKDVLTNEGYQVETSHNGDDGIRVFKEKIFDIIIMDILMPGGINGIEATKEIKKVNKNSKIIFLSGKKLSKENEDELKKIGDDYLAKPFQITELLNAVTRLAH